MFEFWFDPKATFTRKLFIFIITAAITLALYKMNPLSPDAILMFLGTGIIFLICRYCKIQFAGHKPTGLLYRLFTWIPIALLLSLIFMKAQQELLLQGAQGIGFMALATFIFAPIAKLQKNNNRKEPL
ncbi:hypothetical protein [Acinetobacter stercoris]|uniref:Uncharacterized protein n=1 Tax=Acinetobacter stercoris TaxID=2126983 RepID=A0A2U3N1K1_9GAMM|nr:hypothetical protein [Acinetobacter stercoris]SPL71542.1 hypothetical protein KPC_2720 [Acinetobacter stercoris]